jgi:8-hydroxy-5-deazaflavin:NADPH oxidoreductase
MAAGYNGDSTCLPGTNLYVIARTAQESEDNSMKISVLGFGQVGSQLTRLWSAAGHSISIGLRSGSKHQEAANHLKVQVFEPPQATRSAEMIVLALPWMAVEETLRSIGPLEGKILLDATNPLATDLSVLVPKAGSGGQQVAEWSPGAKVIKAFNTIGAACLGNPAFDIYYCSDDAEAAAITHKLIEDTTMRPENVGPLKNARYLEQLAGLWVDLAVNGRMQGAFGFNLVRGNDR